MADNDENDVLEEETEEAEKNKAGLSKPLIIKMLAAVAVVLMIAAGAYFMLTGEDSEKNKDEIVNGGEGRENPAATQHSDKTDSETEQKPDEQLSAEAAATDEKIDSEIEENISTPAIKSDKAASDTPEIELPEIPEDQHLSTSEVENKAAAQSEINLGQGQQGVKDDISKQAVTERDSDTVSEQPMPVEPEVRPEVNAVSQTESGKTEDEKKSTDSQALTKQPVIEQLDPNRYTHIYEEVDKGYPWSRPPKREPPPEPKWGQFDRLSKSE